MPQTALKIGELTFHVVEEGKGVPVLLLHGFPDSSQLWRHQVPVLTGAGFRVIAPDLRGFGRSDKPQAVQDYALPILLGDVTGIMDRLGVERAHVVGHDWGAALAWMLAALFPERVHRLAVLSVGHPAVFATLPIEQREKSWYMLLFQFQGIAEQMLRANEWKLLRDLLRGQGDFDRYIEDLARPGALTAALNWYRANVAPQAEALAFAGLPLVGAPTLGVWSTGDHHLIEAGMIRSAEQVAGPWRYERFEGAGHWIPLDVPERLSGLLREFFGAGVA